MFQDCCFLSPWQWQLFHNISLKEYKQRDMWHFQQFYGVITFTSALRAAAASFVALPFYLFSNILELWCGVRITSAVFSCTQEDKYLLGSSVICQSHLCFGGSRLLLLNEPKSTQQRVPILKQTLVPRIFSLCLLGGFSFHSEWISIAVEASKCTNITAECINKHHSAATAG